MTIKYDVRLVDADATFAKFGYYPPLLKYSRKPVIFICEFCLSRFESSFVRFSASANTNTSCAKCRTISMAYSASKSIEDKHQFYLSKCTEIREDVINDDATKQKFGYSVYDIGKKSKRKIVAICEFCLENFDTTPAVINNGSGVVACKKCDAIAASYSRFKSTANKHEFWKSKRLVFDFKDIDIDGTIKKFGYSPRDISTFSTKKVIAICAYCSDSVVIGMSKYAKKSGNISCSKCVRKKTIKTLQTKYGVSNTLDIPSVRLKLANPLTEQIIETMLASTFKVKFERGYTIGPYSFDFFIPSCNLLIECQGDFFHDFKKNGYSGTQQDRAKSSYIENNTNHKLVWIWEHEIHVGRVKKILDFHIGRTTEQPVSPLLSSLTFSKIDNVNAHMFLSQFHYLGNLGTVATCFGAYSGETLVAVCTFGGVTRQQSIQKVNKLMKKNYGPKNLRELRRFCIRPNVNTENLASYCLKRFIKLCKDHLPDTQAFLSFSDPTVGDIGTIYKASNWVELPETNRSYHYIDTKTSKRIHKKTVWDLAKQSHMSESDFASSAGLVQVEEEPKKVWLKRL